MRAYPVGLAISELRTWRPREGWLGLGHAVTPATSTPVLFRQPPGAQAEFGTKWFWRGFQRGFSFLRTPGMWILPIVGGLSWETHCSGTPSSSEHRSPQCGHWPSKQPLVLVLLPALRAISSQGEKSPNHAVSVSENSSCLLLVSYVQLFRPHGLQHARLPCPSLSPGACSNSCPSSQWHSPTAALISVPPFSSCPQSFPASASFPMSWLFTSGGQSIGASKLLKTVQNGQLSWWMWRRERMSTWYVHGPSSPSLASQSVERPLVPDF